MCFSQEWQFGTRHVTHVVMTVKLCHRLNRIDRDFFIAHRLITVEAKAEVHPVRFMSNISASNYTRTRVTRVKTAWKLIDAATCDGNIRRTVPYLWVPSILSVPAFIACPNAPKLPRDVQTRPSTWRLAAALKRNGADFLEHATENNNNTDSRESRDPGELLWSKSGRSVCIVASVLNWTLETASPRLFHRLNEPPFCSYQFFSTQCFFPPQHWTFRLPFLSFR